jgi:hypothetical protein
MGANDASGQELQIAPKKIGSILIFEKIMDLSLPIKKLPIKSPRNFPVLHEMY